MKIKRNVQMIMGVQSLTLKWISGVFSLKVSLQFRE